MIRAYDLCLDAMWAIVPEALEGLLAIASGTEITADMIRAIHGYDAVEAKRGRRVDNTEAVTSRDGVAIIRVDGSIVRHGDMFSDVSGAVSVNGLARDFDVAVQDPGVRAILFSIDSPGGEVNGIHEFADMIYAARKVKPITAYISHLGASAAYWIASACDQIVADATAQVGSIGVVGAVPNPEKDAKRTVEFVSSQSPHKRADITTDRGRAQVQARVDSLAAVFVASVARNRRTTQDRVLKDFGQGGIFVGKDAVKAGLVDTLGSFEATLAALAAGKPDVADPAARHTGGTIVAEDQEHGQARKSGFWAWVNRQGGDNAADYPTEPPPSGDFGARRDAAPRPDPRIADLEAQLKATQDRQFTAEALAFTEGLVRANQALPAEATALRAQYVQAARDDAAAGVTTRVDQMVAAAALRPATAAPVGERLKGQFMVVPNQLTTGTDEAKELDEEDADTREWARRRNARAK